MHRESVIVGYFLNKVKIAPKVYDRVVLQMCWLNTTPLLHKYSTGFTKMSPSENTIGLILTNGI